MKRIIRLTESDLTRIVRRVINENNKKLFLTEDKIDKADWANKYSAAVKNLKSQHAAAKLPITPVVIGPYCLSTVQNIAGLTVEKLKDQNNYIGDIIGWSSRLGLPSLQLLSTNDVGLFTFDPVRGFINFQVETGVPIDTGVNALNESFNQLPLATIQTMWNSISTEPLYANRLVKWKTNILAYQKNPTDVTKGYDKITGNASTFLKGLKVS